MNKKYSCQILALLLILAAILPHNGFSQQTISREVRLAWDQGVKETSPGGIQGILTFKGSIIRGDFGLLPLYIQSFRLDSPDETVTSIRVENTVFAPLPGMPDGNYRDIDMLSDTIRVMTELSVHRKIPSMNVIILPLRFNHETGMPERLTSFTWILTLKKNTGFQGQTKSSGAYAGHSVLASGNWYKFSIPSGGICQLTYDDLKNAGIDVASINPLNLRIYGNGGGMLPESNATDRIDDLMENAVYVSGETDGHFDPGDYILFYGQSPDSWTYTATDQLFHHTKNIYTDQICYFLNFDLGPGKRIATEPSSGSGPTKYIDRFNDFAYYEKEDLNFIKSGRDWWDNQVFELTLSRNYSFTFPNIDTGSEAALTVKVAARSTTGSSMFAASIDGQKLLSLYLEKTGSGYENDYAKENKGTARFTPTNQVLTVNLLYSKPSGAIGYLNYLEINATRLLTQSGSQMAFRSVSSVMPGGITEFSLNGNNQNIQIWDVTATGEPRQLVPVKNGNTYTFRVETTVLKEFLSFDGGSYIKPTYIGKVENQNLHGTDVADYIMVCYPDFLAEAERLAEFHREKSNLSVFITTPQKIYNEFSSGSQDITAIRDFVRMMYNRAIPGKEPKYLLLFGDASYDYKNRIQNNTNFVPAFESENSLSPEKSFVSDDYFVLLDPTEGQGDSGDLDMGVGRLPVSGLADATNIVNKILHYCSGSDSVKNDWRNVVTFVADDQNLGENRFIQDSEDLARIVDTTHQVYNIDKIYSDAYTMVSTPGGNRYPEVNEVINKRVTKGSLIMNYVGHGGEVGWAHERILEVADIQGWRNLDNMPVFVTATCEFSRYDDPERVSAGEWVFLNKNGGGIALFTTSRLTYAGPNKSLLVNLYKSVFEKDNGQYLNLGDLLMAAKYQMGSYANIHAFVLLGDPAIHMDYPDLNVVTTSINSQVPTSVPDTLKALSEITITGEVRDDGGQKASYFTGTVFPTVFDKEVEVWTKANYNNGDKFPFMLRKNPVYKGKVQVTNGSFSYSFIVPKDIAYKYGTGKISYYARSPETDAQGYDENIQVGGYNSGAEPDNQGPEVVLFMNDRNFVSGGITNQNPTLLADICDSSGINTVGNGIGHDITAVIDDITTVPIILNNYYVTNLNTFKSGSITYPLSTLSEGEHHLSVKVWDVYNNSAEARIGFVVVNSTGFALEHLISYPNPMQDQTTFSWETNQVHQPLEVEITIFTLTGNLVKTIRQTVYNQGFRTAMIHWDGTLDNGRKVSSGMYVYRLQTMLEDGTAKHMTSKLVVIR
ncbi:MAG: type IX secretion system sortase PorU [Bacteroidales bacterium]|nr:type IX secretion system sortase PorU [Bacteroidales bacterium]